MPRIVTTFANLPSAWQLDPKSSRTIGGDLGNKIAIVGAALLPLMLIGFTIFVAKFAHIGSVENLYCAKRRWKEEVHDMFENGGQLPPQYMFWYHDISDYLALLKREGHVWFTLIALCILSTLGAIPAGDKCRARWAVCMGVISSIAFVGVTFVNSDTSVCKWRETHNQEFKVHPYMHGVVTNLAFICQLVYISLHITMRLDHGRLAWLPLAIGLALIICPGATSWFFKTPVPSRHIGEWMCVGFVGCWYLSLSTVLVMVRARFKNFNFGVDEGTALVSQSV